MSQIVIEGLHDAPITIRKVMPDAHWSWLAKGWGDFRANWATSARIGLIPTLIAWVFVTVLWTTNLMAFLPAICGAFALIGPVLAVGCYEISRRRDLAAEVTMSTVLRPKMKAPGQVALIAFALMFLVLIWGRMASLLYALASSNSSVLQQEDFIAFALQTPEGLAMIAVGSIIGAAISVIAFTISVISIPLVSSRRVDAMTAMVISSLAVMRNKGAMASFAFNIAMLIGVSLATGFLALIVVFPWLGHATWRAYRDVIDDGVLPQEVPAG